MDRTRCLPKDYLCSISIIWLAWLLVMEDIRWWEFLVIYITKQWKIHSGRLELHIHQNKRKTN